MIIPSHEPVRTLSLTRDTCHAQMHKTNRNEQGHRRQAMSPHVHECCLATRQSSCTDQGSAKWCLCQQYVHAMCAGRMGSWAHRRIDACAVANKTVSYKRALCLCQQFVPVVIFRRCASNKARSMHSVHSCLRFKAVPVLAACLGSHL